ncbi:MAG TPA: pseudouridine synthase [Bdellovibrionales bacterium]|nr:MAG: hypothetical protein A2Z97_06710 [Bdellovibrionales bacterium GWB1_52_6]OFZ05500.1 MAG: hypothetical protein A2X97_11530 [Bdellovibrionales bacterium GWA1_52_35]OFZ36304.1 MAG: hypothetical protein A2070_13040 [Bdellovibrionales bacterium GWC1_52_8]HAR41548.1 pseudouridine synthase [Bdellovibrionales bacterium]HCM39135.1 pseudouridine synthase [Bdellovibrionales bacterium]
MGKIIAQPPKRKHQVPLERALSKLGFASRTQARELIQAGKVEVNGAIRRSPLYPVNPERAKIEIAGTSLKPAESRYFLLNKPRGLITTRSDEKGRPTVFSLFPDLKFHLSAVGRLDQATSGLLLFTNDTGLAAWLTDPASEIPRIYLVSVRGKVTEEEIDKLREGFLDGKEFLIADEVTIRKASGRESHLTVTLSEGKNREIRRLFKALGHEVTRLKRVAYGPLELGELAPGTYRELTLAEIRAAFPKAPLGI